MVAVGYDPIADVIAVAMEISAQNLLEPFLPKEMSDRLDAALTRFFKSREGTVNLIPNEDILPPPNVLDLFLNEDQQDLE